MAFFSQDISIAPRTEIDYVAIIAMIAYGWWMNHIPVRADRFFYRSIHANIGYAILVLMAVRLIWLCPRISITTRAGTC